MTAFRRPPARPLGFGSVSMELATSQLRGLSIGRPDRIHYLCLDVLRLIFEMV